MVNRLFPILDSRNIYVWNNEATTYLVKPSSYKGKVVGVEIGSRMKRMVDKLTVFSLSLFKRTIQS